MYNFYYYNDVKYMIMNIIIYKKINMLRKWCFYMQTNLINIIYFLDQTKSHFSRMMIY
jgi:hypothetical protein